MQASNGIPFNDLSRTPSDVRAEIDAALARVLASGWFMLGPENEAFQAELAAYLGVSEVVPLANGTDALELALAAVGVVQGDHVVTVANAGAYGTIATRLLGGIPVYAEIDETTLLPTAELVRAAIESAPEKPKAMIVTHLYGAMAPVVEIVAVAREYGIAVVEDCAQSLGARRGARAAGTFGDIATTSFYPTKNLGALGDAGAVYTDDASLAERVRRLRQYGWDSKYHIAFDHGRNSRMDELQAAILRVKLGHLDDGNERRRQIHARYEAVSSPAARVVNSASESFIGHLAVLVAPDRDGFRAAMKDAGVGTDVHYPIPDHQQDFPTGAVRGVSLPVTERISARIVSVPLFPELTEPEIDRIAAALAVYGSADV